MTEATTQGAGNTPTTGAVQSGATGAAAAPVAATAAVATSAAPAAAAVAAAAPASTPQQATEGQPAAQTAAAKPEGEGTPAKTGAPEKYEFKAPAGTVLDDVIVAEFSTLAKGMGLDQVTAQKVIDTLAPRIVEQNAKALTTAINKASDEWAVATRADKDIGGDKLNENLAVANKALTAYGSPELRALLGKFDPKDNPKGTGLGNHPELIKLFHRIGKSISEDKPVGGTTAPSKDAKSAADTLYPQKS